MSLIILKYFSLSLLIHFIFNSIILYTSIVTPTLLAFTYYEFSHSFTSRLPTLFPVFYLWDVNILSSHSWPLPEQKSWFQNREVLSPGDSVSFPLTLELWWLCGHFGQGKELLALWDVQCCAWSLRRVWVPDPMDYM